MVKAAWAVAACRHVPAVGCGTSATGLPRVFGPRPTSDPTSRICATQVRSDSSVIRSAPPRPVPRTACCAALTEYSC
eukprot:scaffold81952_cov61-Phaeocystis_antarctica.AAC.1